jgi:hypothetical protein
MDEPGRQPGPAHLDVGHVEGRLLVKLAELAGDRLGAADDEVDRMSTKPATFLAGA